MEANKKLFREIELEHIAFWSRSRKRKKMVAVVPDGRVHTECNK